MGVVVKFFPIDIAYSIIEGKPQIRLFGRSLEDGRRIQVVDNSFEPYFYVTPKKGQPIKEKLTKLRIEEERQVYEVRRVDEVEKKIKGVTVKTLKVVANIPRAVPKLRDVIKNWEVVDTIHEYDILFTRRYLLDKGITPMTMCEVQGEILQTRSRVKTIEAAKIKQFSTDMYRDPKILAVDIETYSTPSQPINFEKNPILMIAFYGKNFRKVYAWKSFKHSLDYVEFVNSERELIEKFKETVEAYKPDILTGYYSDGFDLPYIKARADKHKVRLDIAPDFSEMKLRMGNETAVQITGMTHLDIFKFIKKVMRGTLETEAYNLNAVALELLGEEKKDVDVTDLPAAWDTHDHESLERFAEYNLHDASLAFRLTESMLPTVIELVKIVGMPIYDINRMGFSQLVEWYLLKQASQVNIIAPNKPDYNEVGRRRLQSYQGGFVFEPKPGLYKDIVVYDYLSLYPTIISSHNIDPDTLHCVCCKETSKKTPGEEGYWFCSRKKGFIPELIGDIITRRMRVKEIMKTEGKTDRFLDARQNALKLMANSFYGYLGFYGARWYSLESAKSTTSWGRYYIHQVIAKAEKEGFQVLYSDTDSVFLSLGGKTRENADTFAAEVNESLPGLMELEFDGYYPSGIFVSAKLGASGAKKKYALVNQKGEMKIRGFETVRRNWSKIAKETQEEVLRIILHEHDEIKALNYVKDVIQDLRNAEIPLAKVIIKTQLVKDLLDYAAKGPHVAVAQRLRNKGMSVGPGTIIEYVVARGSDIIRNRARLPEEISQKEYDAEYYISHQVVPSVDRIFAVLGYKKEELLDNKEQKKLSGFF